MARADVSVALLAPGVSPRLEDVLRGLRARPSGRLREVFGVGEASRFPAGLRVAAPASPTPAAAKNAALRAAETPYVLLLSADTVLTLDVVERLAAGLDARPDLIALAALPCHESGWAMPWLFRYPTVRSELAGSLAPLRGRAFPSPKKRRGEAGATWWFRLEAALVRRDPALDLPPWPEALRFGFEDAVWLRRAREAGRPAEIAEEAFAYCFAPKQVGPVPREVRLAWEASRARLIETLWPPAAARRRLGLRRLALALRAALTRLLSALYFGRNRKLRRLARETAWAGKWHDAGRPTVRPAPGVERRVWWEGLL